MLKELGTERDSYYLLYSQLKYFKRIQNAKSGKLFV